MPTLSDRLPPQLTAELLQEAPLAPGVIDLGAGNPTLCGLGPSPAWLGALPLAAAWQQPYRPAPLGQPAAREALAAALRQLGRPAQADDLVLCASTSEAFAFLFKVWLNPGETVAVGQPGYPLVQHLAELEGLKTTPVRSLFLPGAAAGAGHWRLALDEVRQALAQGARAVVLISPNNPTGACLCPEDMAALAALCNAAGALVVLDEVFAPYGWAPGAPTTFLPLVPFDRVVSLGGLSKAVCLPQAKLSWIQLGGSAAFRDAMRAGLCWVADAALSVGDAVQTLLPRLCQQFAVVQAAVRARVAENLGQLRQLLAGAGAGPALGQLWPAAAGWYAMVQLPWLGRDAHTGRLAELERRARVRLLPGWLFDLQTPPGALLRADETVVTSLILPPADFADGWRRVAAIARAIGKAV